MHATTAASLIPTSHLEALASDPNIASSRTSLLPMRSFTNDPTPDGQRYNRANGVTCVEPRCAPRRSFLCSHPL
jgi:hypothetical protein